MLEGKEAEGKIGSSGAYSVDVDSKGVVEVKLGAGNFDQDGAEAGAYVKVDLISLLEKAAEKSEQKWDDTVIATIKGYLGK